VFGCVSSQFYATWEQNQAGADFFGLFWAVRWIGRCINETMSVGRGEVCNIKLFFFVFCGSSNCMVVTR
jgi:hypothetical protein